MRELDVVMFHGFTPIESCEQRADGARAPTAARCCAAWLTGLAVYMVVMGATAYAGMLSLPIQLACGAIWSGVVVAGCLILGLPLRVPRVGRAWNERPWVGGITALVGLALVLFSIAPGQMVEYTEGSKALREAGHTCLPGYILLSFALVNFPRPARVVRCNTTTS